MGVAVDYLKAGLRKFPVGEYMIFYDVPDKDYIVIRRVLHQRRDIEPLIKRGWSNITLDGNFLTVLNGA